MPEHKIEIAKTLDALRATISKWRLAGEKIAFVPTMGALHDGHISLVTLGHQYADKVVASIFVNPTQFAAHEDLDTYPRTEDDDLKRLHEAGCDLVYMPDVDTMYPPGNQTAVSVPEMERLLEGEFRPHFFGGVCTVVSRLFVHVQPDVAIFGEKDYQQLCIIQRMTTDFGFPIKIFGGPTVREACGLAMSSRNAYLSEKWRRRSSALFNALHRARMRIEAGTAVTIAMAEAYDSITKAGYEKVDYLAACDPVTLQPVGDGPLELGQEIRLLGAIWADTTRLIDNMACQRRA